MHSDQVYLVGPFLTVVYGLTSLLVAEGVILLTPFGLKSKDVDYQVVRSSLRGDDGSGGDGHASCKSKFLFDIDAISERGPPSW